jgi:hypothetical protein
MSLPRMHLYGRNLSVWQGELLHTTFFCSFWLLQELDFFYW